MKNFLKWASIGFGVCLSFIVVSLFFSDDDYDDYNDYDKYYDSDDYDDDYYDDDYYDDYNDYDDDYNDSHGSEKTPSSGSGSNKKNTNDKFSLGSASEMEGTTVVLSLYTDDKRSEWNSSSNKLMNNSLSYLGVSCSWLTKQCSRYNKNASFVYDWSKDSDLKYDISLNCDMLDDNSSYNAIENYLDDFEYESVMEKYNADNIIFMFFVNTPENNDQTSWTHMYIEDLETYPLEFCVIYMNVEGYEENPSAIAHEMMHTFGAPDLYVADNGGDNFGVTQKYVNYMEKTNSNDIMYTNYDCDTGVDYYDKISNEMSDLDAYYLGLTDYSEVAEEWGFAKSQH